MSTRILLSCLTIAFVSTWLLASESKPNSELKSIAQSLEPIFKEFDAKVIVEHDENGQSLEVTYLPQTFKIHAVSKSGEIAAKAHDEVGPSCKGFVLRLHLQPKGEVNAAITPQTLHRPYWLTDLNVTPLGKTDKQIYWGLSYGSRTDNDVLKKIRVKLEGLSE